MACAADLPKLPAPARHCWETVSRHFGDFWFYVRQVVRLYDHPVIQFRYRGLYATLCAALDFPGGVQIALWEEEPPDQPLGADLVVIFPDIEDDVEVVLMAPALDGGHLQLPSVHPSVALN
jgi:hypothetical protein